MQNVGPSDDLFSPYMGTRADLNENEVRAKKSIKRSLYYLNSEGMKQ